nr:FAD-dependent oxidoreductase [Williamsia sterculiae]
MNCIHPTPGEPGFGTTEMLFIDPAACVGCGNCVGACPVGAIANESSLMPTQLPFAELNRTYYDEFPHDDRPILSPLTPQRRLRAGGPFRIAVIGAGPAGMFAADELLKHPEIAAVDVFERQSTPYGLARRGVAPDHTDTKKVADLFAAIEAQPRFAYHFGVSVGTDITIDELRSRYNGVIVAVGAPADRRLLIPGEDLRGSLAATQVVGWYNGDPDHADVDVPLTHNRAVVIGNGNVALDVARMLTRDPEWLETHTDIASGALGELYGSTVDEVVVLGRRGPADAAFTVPELIGLSTLTDVDVVVDAEPDTLTGADTRSRLLRELAERPQPSTPGVTRIVLRFATTPIEIIGDGHGVTGVRVANTGHDDADEIIDAGLVVRAIGHRGRPVTGLPFDEVTGTIPNDRGRVEPGVYVTGWIKRGPRGFIGTNKTCAEETVGAVLDDLERVGPPLHDAVSR